MLSGGNRRTCALRPKPIQGEDDCDVPQYRRPFAPLARSAAPTANAYQTYVANVATPTAAAITAKRVRLLADSANVA